MFSDHAVAVHAEVPLAPGPADNRTHCLAWSDWLGEPTVELANGMRMDVNYYYWPSAWVKNRPGFMTGSGIPMRFANTDGTQTTSTRRRRR